jgi:hypothetical protein
VQQAARFKGLTFGRQNALVQVSSTALTLLVLPVVYGFFEGKANLGSAITSGGSS